MPRQILCTVAALALAASAGACSSSRFDTGLNASARPVGRPARPLPPEEPDLGPGLSSGPVTSAPLAPPPGASAAPVVANPSGPIMAEPSPPPPVQQQASIAPPPPPPVVASGGRSAVVGGWTAKDATGASCRVTLASTPALDLYKASSAGCANKDLAKVTAWDYRDGEVYLYQPGGTVAARLRPAGGAMDGALSKSGAPLAMVR
ncbi:AprI/Inh family metalloprotease inhibitor [Methylobacterium sp. SyP6R]|uniref:AprI/Inh family metalloprotease inhibitor n=1 Tax=Methylobacterium sp. SyP6R TaxID=2718876 RepID=UPI001F3AD224|nr:AprI/Inh family metalloprotease inhibitor [Methylobacterium sp. SyP6R]MCF4128747.1 protease inhibitor Inh/omp19 family protein [Methylobacterium sp. SyP6R]